MRAWVREQFAALKSSGAGKVIARILPTWQQAQPLPQPDDYAAFAKHGFRQNAIVFSCVAEIASSTSEPDLVVESLAGEGEWSAAPSDHGLVRLLSNPNPETLGAEMLFKIAVHQQVAGNAYVHKVRSGTKQVKQAPISELWLLRPDRTRVVPGPDGRVIGYDYTPPGMTKAERLPPEDVIHLPFLPDPLDDYYGLSPLAVAARMIDMDNQSVDYMRAFFLNAGVPAGLLKLKSKVHPSERLRVKETWREEYNGLHIDPNSGQSLPRGFHGVAVVDGGADYQELGTRPEKLRMQAVWDGTESRICACFNVPPVIVGVMVGLQYSTFSNYQEARRSFWQETLSPMFGRIAGKLTMGLASEFGDPTKLRLRFKLEDVDAMQEDRDRKSKRAESGWNSGLLTLNEARAEIGKPPIQGGDVRKVSGLDAETPVVIETASRRALPAGDRPALPPAPEVSHRNGHRKLDRVSLAAIGELREVLVTLGERVRTAEAQGLVDPEKLAASGLGGAFDRVAEKLGKLGTVIE